MEQTQIEVESKASFESFFKAITNYQDYSHFVPGCSHSKVLRQDSKEKDSHAQNVLMTQVAYEVSLLNQKINYELIHSECSMQKTERGLFQTMNWRLVEGSSLTFKENTGSWELHFDSRKSNLLQVRYSIDLQFKIFVPKFVLKPLIQTSLPQMIAAFETKALELDRLGA